VALALTNFKMIEVLFLRVYPAAGAPTRYYMIQISIYMYTKLAGLKDIPWLRYTDFTY